MESGILYILCNTLTEKKKLSAEGQLVNGHTPTVDTGTAGQTPTVDRGAAGHTPTVGRGTAGHRLSTED